MCQSLKLDSTRCFIILAYFFCCWKNGISTVSFCLASAPGQYLLVASQEFSCSLWEGDRTSFSSIHLLGITQSPWSHPAQESHMKNYQPNTVGMIQTLFRISRSHRTKAGYLWQWVMPRSRGDLDCIQSSQKEPWIHSGPLKGNTSTGSWAPWTCSFCQGCPILSTGTWKKWIMRGCGQRDNNEDWCGLFPGKVNRNKRVWFIKTEWKCLYVV